MVFAGKCQLLVPDQTEYEQNQGRQAETVSHGKNRGTWVNCSLIASQVDPQINVAAMYKKALTMHYSSDRTAISALPFSSSTK